MSRTPTPINANDMAAHEADIEAGVQWMQQMDELETKALGTTIRMLQQGQIPKDCPTSLLHSIAKLAAAGTYTIHLRWLASAGQPAVSGHRPASTYPRMHEKDHIALEQDLQRGMKFIEQATTESGAQINQALSHLMLGYPPERASVYACQAIGKLAVLAWFFLSAALDERDTKAGVKPDPRPVPPPTKPTPNYPTPEDTQKERRPASTAVEEVGLEAGTALRLESCAWWDLAGPSERARICWLCRDLVGAAVLGTAIAISPEDFGRIAKLAGAAIAVHRQGDMKPR